MQETLKVHSIQKTDLDQTSQLTYFSKHFPHFSHEVFSNFFPSFLLLIAYFLLFSTNFPPKTVFSKCRSFFSHTISVQEAARIRNIIILPFSGKFGKYLADIARKSLNVREYEDQCGKKYV